MGGAGMGEACMGVAGMRVAGMGVSGMGDAGMGDNTGSIDLNRSLSMVLMSPSSDILSDIDGDLLCMLVLVLVVVLLFDITALVIIL